MVPVTPLYTFSSHQNRLMMAATHRRMTLTAQSVHAPTNVIELHSCIYRDALMVTGVASNAGDLNRQLSMDTRLLVKPYLIRLLYHQAELTYLLSGTPARRLSRLNKGLVANFSLNELSVIQAAMQFVEQVHQGFWSYSLYSYFLTLAQLKAQDVFIAVLLKNCVLAIEASQTNSGMKPVNITSELITSVLKDINLEAHDAETQLFERLIQHG